MTKNLSRCPAYILAGGRSRRFGSDKALALFQNQPLIQGVFNLLHLNMASVVVIAQQPDAYAFLKTDLLTDLPEYQGLGPLAGIATALQYASEQGYSGYVFIASCDVLGVKVQDILTLYQSAQGALAVAYKHRYWEPLWAFYHTDARDQIHQALTNNMLKLQALLDTLGARALPAEDLQWAPINTPQALSDYQNQV